MTHPKHPLHGHLQAMNPGVNLSTGELPQEHALSGVAYLNVPKPGLVDLGEAAGASAPANDAGAYEDGLPNVERALLGGLLANNATYNRVRAYLRPEHFSDPTHAFVFDAIARTIEGGGTADAATISRLFSEAGLMDESHGASYLADLLGAMVGTINVGEYGRAVFVAYLRRTNGGGLPDNLPDPLPKPELTTEEPSTGADYATPVPDLPLPVPAITNEEANRRAKILQDACNEALSGIPLTHALDLLASAAARMLFANSPPPDRVRIAAAFNMRVCEDLYRIDRMIAEIQATVAAHEGAGATPPGPEAA